MKTNMKTNMSNIINNLGPYFSGSRRFLDNTSSFLAGSLHFSRCVTTSTPSTPFSLGLDSQMSQNIKYKNILVVFSLPELSSSVEHSDLSIIRNRISKVLRDGVHYTVFTKIRYYSDLYCMAGPQFGFKFIDDSDLVSLTTIVLDRISTCLNKYSLEDDDIVYIQLLFKQVDPTIITEFQKQVITNLQETHISDMHAIGDYQPTLPDIDNVSVNKAAKDVIPSYTIPVSVDPDTLGIPLKVESNINHMITSITLNIDGNTVNFLDSITAKSKYLRASHKDVFTSMIDSFKFYYIVGLNNKYVLAINKTNDGTYHKIRFNTSGVVLNNVFDKLVGDNLILRTDGNINYLISDGKVLSTEQNIRLFPLNKPKLDLQNIDNPNIGTIDTEVYTDNDGIHKIYCLGFKTNLDDQSTIYYVESRNNINSSDIVLQLVNELLRPRYSDIHFYCHNLGGYDIHFLLKVLLDYNDDIVRENSNNSPYKISTVFRDNKVLQITISKIINDTNRSFVIKDSYSLLNSSLADLGKSFNVSVTKGIFPYSFASSNNLFYKGNTPDITYYNNITTEDYNKLFTNNWSFRDETINYIEKDLISLHQVISKANKQTFLDYNIDLIDSLTISSLAMKLFMFKYYNNNIPMINKPSMYNDIKQAYYGGITEVYKPYGENLYYYDVNSLYPYAALNDMPGLVCKKESFSTDNIVLDNLFGFYYCEVECDTNNYLGLLPVSNNSGIFFPNGKWSGWYFSEELKFAKSNGYKVKVINGYTFNRTKDVFKDYIKDIYKIKSNPINPVQKSMAKSFLNNLLGRFGIRLDKTITEILTESAFDKLSTMKKVTDYKKLSENKVLVTYINKLDNEVIKSHELDIIKLSNKYTDNETTRMDNTSVAISAAVTAYARIFMSQIKLDILKSGGNIYYTDTDSIVTDNMLEESLVDDKSIGKFKLEYIVKKGIFISGKTYCLITDDDKFINRAKGVKSNFLVYEDYEKLLNNDLY